MKKTRSSNNGASKRFATLLAAGVACLAVPQLQADSVTFRSTSEVRSVNNIPGVSVGDIITVTYTFDSDAVDYQPTLPTHGRYQEAVTSLSVNIGGVDYGISPDPAREQRLAVLNDAPAAGGVTVDTYAHYFDLDNDGGWLWMNLVSTDLAVFDDDSLPVYPPDVTNFDRASSLVLERWSGGTRGQGTRTARMVADVLSLVRVDETAPVVTAAVADDTLWSPNHKMVNVGLGAIVEDDLDPDPLVEVLVFSNEPNDGSGDGNTDSDSVVGADGSLNLRAERSGNGAGRVYLVMIFATDADGNTGYDCATVVVPKSRGKKDVAAVVAAAIAAEEICLEAGEAPEGWYLLN